MLHGEQNINKIGASVLGSPVVIDVLDITIDFSS